MNKNNFMMVVDEQKRNSLNYILKEKHKKVNFIKVRQVSTIIKKKKKTKAQC